MNFTQGFVWKKTHKLIKFNQQSWLKLCIDIDTELRKKGKNNFE